MGRRAIMCSFLFVVIFSFSNIINAQNHYNVRKFRIYVPPGWKMDDHDVHYLEISSTQTMFLLYFYVIDNDDTEYRWKAILNSLSKRLNFSDELSDKGEFDLQNGFHLIYGFSNVTLIEGGAKVKLITSQIGNDPDYTIIVYGFCSPDNFSFSKNQLWHIYENIRYKDE